MHIQKGLIRCIINVYFNSEMLTILSFLAKLSILDSTLLLRIVPTYQQIMERYLMVHHKSITIR